MHGEEKVESATKRALHTKVVALGHSGLNSVPMPLIMRMGDMMSKMVRLDLSHNFIQTIPTEISLLSSLQELWLQFNPLVNLTGIAKLQNLEVLDIRGTHVQALPSDMATLKRLYEIDWRETPLALNLLKQHAIEVNDLPTTMALLHEQHIREGLESTLLESLSGVKFMKEADVPGMAERIEQLVHTISDMYQDLEEFSLFVRRADSLLPDKINECTPNNLKRVKDSFEEMQRQTTRKRLAADVEIKLRAVYFDRASRQEIDTMLTGIYQNVSSLEDIEHLVQYVVEIMPPEPADVTGPLVWKNLLAHQALLTAKRQAAIATLATSMQGLYPEQRPVDLAEKAKEVASVFATERFATKKELERLTQVSAEASKLFPADFPSIVPHEVKEAARIMFKSK